MPIISDRAVIRFGKGGLVITIPKGWADYYDLRPGDKLRVIADDGLWILAPQLGREKKAQPPSDRARLRKEEADDGK
jgi:bifunctional DNA-binding transcriptional regulator/antitoxin component of YhaV-PrlF toxin-antitoxin module